MSVTYEKIYSHITQVEEYRNDQASILLYCYTAIIKMSYLCWQDSLLGPYHKLILW